jgi:hypothetical protein
VISEPVFGSGLFDLAPIPGFISDVELAWLWNRRSASTGSGPYHTRTQT